MKESKSKWWTFLNLVISFSMLLGVSFLIYWIAFFVFNYTNNNNDLYTLHDQEWVFWTGFGLSTIAFLCLLIFVFYDNNNNNNTLITNYTTAIFGLSYFLLAFVYILSSILPLTYIDYANINIGKPFLIAVPTISIIILISNIVFLVICPILIEGQNFGTL